VAVSGGFIPLTRRQEGRWGRSRGGRGDDEGRQEPFRHVSNWRIVRDGIAWRGRDNHVSSVAADIDPGGDFGRAVLHRLVGPAEVEMQTAGACADGSRLHHAVAIGIEPCRALGAILHVHIDHHPPGNGAGRNADHYGGRILEHATDGRGVRGGVLEAVRGQGALVRIAGEHRHAECNGGVCQRG